MNILLLHGPNLNWLGQRSVEHYGTCTLHEIEKLTIAEAQRHHLDVLSYQSNDEGKLIDILQKIAPFCRGIIINPGALAHYAYALHDALVDTHLPVIEVHLSDIQHREDWRKLSVTAPACKKVISGRKEQGYVLALQALIEYMHGD